ncbi:MAG: lysophospholipid acyltransferase family protein [Gemmatimonadetes bacterium]|nr:lysophospholipid acyltransferase family protein [Gemmatimonadota bacterium]
MPEAVAGSGPILPPSVPRRRSLGRRLIGSAVLRAMGWRITGAFPDLRKFVVIVAPHTSNWDFIVGFAAYLAIELDASWLGKHTIFRWPFGALFRYFGGIPVVRSQAANVVDLHVREFNAREHLVFVIAPEGTRKRIPEWKSGFYRIAVGAGVAIVPVALDFGQRLIRILPPFTPTSDYEADLGQLKANFTRDMARRPEGF